MTRVMRGDKSLVGNCDASRFLDKEARVDLRLLSHFDVQATKRPEWSSYVILTKCENFG